MFRYILTALFLATPAVCEPPRVVTDIPAVHSLVSQVMEGVATPDLLMDGPSDPHSFQLRPNQVRSLAEADLIFWIGPELTPWLDRTLENTAPQGETISLLWSDGTKRIDYDDHAEMHGEEGHDAHDDHDHEDTHDEHDHGDAHDEHDHNDGHDSHEDGHDDHAHEGHNHEGTDPHAWLDPENAVVWLSVIETHLSEADPENADTYAKNANAARTELVNLQSEVATMLDPFHDRPFYVFHDAYGYFTIAFDLKIAGTIAEGDAATPGAERLSEIREGLMHADTVCIFAEANHNSDYVETVAEGTNAKIGTLDPSGIQYNPGAALYGQIIRGLAQEISSCHSQ